MHTYSFLLKQLGLSYTQKYGDNDDDREMRNVNDRNFGLPCNSFVHESFHSFTSKHYDFNTL